MIFTLPHLPDPSLGRYRRRFGANAFERASQTLGSVAALLLPGEEVGLRFRYDPERRPREHRTALFLWLPAAQHANVVGAHEVEEFLALEPTTAEEAVAGWDGLDEACLLQLGQAEEGLETADLSWAPVPFAPGRDDADPVVLDRLFDTLAVPCLVDFVARAAGYTEAEVAALLAEQEFLGLRGHDVERRDAGRSEELHRRRDAIAERHRSILETQLQRVQAPLYESTIRVACGEPRVARLVARTVARLVAGEGPCSVEELEGTQRAEAEEAIRACKTHIPSFVVGETRIYSAWLAARLEELARRDRARAQRLASLSRLRYLAGPETVQRMVRLPLTEGLPLRTLVIETERARLSQEESRPVRMGWDAERQAPLHSRADALVNHAFVTGCTGSGKSTTLRGVLGDVLRLGIPILVVEPAKTEYRELLHEGDVRLFTPGNEWLSAMRFNPFEVPAGVRVDEHVSLLMECFAGAIEMLGPFPSLLLTAIERVYDAHGIDGEDLGEECATFPVMRELVAAVRDVMAARGYVGEVRANLESALSTRLEPLTRGSIGRLFDAERSRPSVPELLAHPAVLELVALNGAQQNLLTLFLLSAIYREARRRGPSNTLRNLLVLEEAHNLVGTSDVRGDLADPRGHATRFVTRLLAEIRAYGVGMIVVDQSPSAVAPDVVKNTATKIVHQLVAAEDRERMAAGMALDDLGALEIARLPRGEAYVAYPGLARPAHVAMAPTETRAPLDDEALRRLLETRPWYRAATLTALARETAGLLALSQEYLAVEARRARTWTATDRARFEAVLARAERKISRRARRLRSFKEPAATRLATAYQRRFAALVRAASQTLSKLTQKGA